MGRSIETKIAAHEIAGARRSQGLSPWAGKLDVSDIFHDDDTDIWAKAREIAARISRAPWYNEDDNELVDITYELTLLGRDFTNDIAEATETFDDIWDRFYDWCDLAGRIWVRTR
ncbi:MAG: hypothetical protein KA758_02810 [Acidimicrobiales bacterium]|nr:hypothetical protein [Acidimicrobiales bacterium]